MHHILKEIRNEPTNFCAVIKDLYEVMYQTPLEISHIWKINDKKSQNKTEKKNCKIDCQSCPSVYIGESSHTAKKKL